MFVLGHIGITTGAYKACDIFLSMLTSSSSKEANYRYKSSPAVNEKRLRLHRLADKIKEWTGRIDYRMVMVGSVLPDIIDKPVFLLFGGTATLSGRDYAHTLLVNLSLLIGGLVLLRYGRSWLLIISTASFMHLILDQMWNYATILLWPLLGPLPGAEITDLFSYSFFAMLNIPEVYIPEIIGLVILLLLFYRLVKNRGVTGFITRGAVD
jgi:inner membrane protein